MNIMSLTGLIVVASSLLNNNNFVNLGDYVSKNVQTKISKYLIDNPLYDKMVYNYKARDFEDFKKYITFFCKVKIVEGEYTLFLNQED
jgi:hypothetical protein